MADACRALDYPIVSGNVSLYNESKATGGGSAILPTPAIGGVGVLEDVSKMATIGFKAEGEAILIVGGPDIQGKGNLGQSLWLREIHGAEDGSPPAIDLVHERKVGEYIRELVAQGLVTAVHDVSDGGLMVAITEMCLAGNVGAVIDDDYGYSTGFLFGESQGSYILSVSGENYAAVVDLAEGNGIGAYPLGSTSGASVGFNDAGGRGFKVPLADLRAAHESFFKDWMES
jgi:phosphoribosylformylglycinamidine synthase